MLQSFQGTPLKLAEFAFPEYVMLRRDAGGGEGEEGEGENNCLQFCMESVAPLSHTKTLLARPTKHQTGVCACARGCGAVSVM